VHSASLLPAQSDARIPDADNEWAEIKVVSHFEQRARSETQRCQPADKPVPAVQPVHCPFATGGQHIQRNRSGSGITPLNRFGSINQHLRGVHGVHPERNYVEFDIRMQALLGTAFI
jgi:hypothetical protein